MMGEISMPLCVMSAFLILSSIIARASKFAGIPDEALPTRSGYLTIDEGKGTKMFYLYYEAQRPPEPRDQNPVIVWLQGGPGCSGLVGCFFELGPWRIDDDMEFHANPATWNRLHGLLFLDSPVGTGFSVVPEGGHIPTGDEEVARDLAIALRLFFTQILPSRGRRPLYLAGESYAGKYIPALSYHILSQEENSAEPPPLFQLKGMAIGDGITHPVAQIPVYGPAAHYMGLIDEDQMGRDETLGRVVVEHTNDGRFDLAAQARLELMGTVYEQTGLATFTDIRKEVGYHEAPGRASPCSELCNSESFKKALGAEASLTWIYCRDDIIALSQNQRMRSAKHWVEYALSRVPVLLYQGVFDLQYGVASNERWMREINWTGISDFWGSRRAVWELGGVTAGHVRTWSNLSHVVILGAGHLVPADQGLRSQAMIEAWIAGKLDSLASSKLHYH